MVISKCSGCDRALFFFFFVLFSFLYTFSSENVFLLFFNLFMFLVVLTLLTVVASVLGSTASRCWGFRAVTYGLRSCSTRA